MTITGDKKYKDRLKRLSSKQKNQLIAAKLYAAGQKIEIDAERSITAGSITGLNHVPSAPGEPPNADTRHLDTNIETVIKTQNPPTVTVTSHAEYSAALEYGTSKMAERPFMRPAVKKNKDRVARLVKEAVSTVIRRG